MNSLLNPVPEWQFVLWFLFVSAWIRWWQMIWFLEIFLIILILFPSWDDLLHPVRKLHSGRLTILQRLFLFLPHRWFEKGLTLIQQPMTVQITRVSIALQVITYHVIILFILLVDFAYGTDVRIDQTLCLGPSDRMIEILFEKRIVLVIFLTWIKVFFSFRHVLNSANIFWL